MSGGKKKNHLATALALRGQGATLEKISQLTGVSMNTLSKWFREEGIDQLLEKSGKNPICQAEKIDDMIARLIDEIYEKGGIPTPAQADAMKKLQSMRQGALKSDDKPRMVALVFHDFIRYVGNYIESETERQAVFAACNRYLKYIEEVEYGK